MEPKFAEFDVNDEEFIGPVMEICLAQRKLPTLDDNDALRTTTTFSSTY